ncbi:hypothetical protein WKI68_09565 [Streptomyces sp. MS1.HAVA.3]|uniref:Uncharacterized protein n=1 Tax=Streptomyces caledonius TaxID=3134107 RepID=A0ABU8U2S5_9ACTN
MLLLLVLVVGLVLGAILYVAVVHPRLAGPLSAVGGIAAALGAAVIAAYAVRRR